MALGLIIKKSWAVDENGNKLDDPKDPRRRGVHYIYTNDTEVTIMDKIIYNADGTPETNADKFARLYGKEYGVTKNDYDNSKSWSQNVNELRFGK